MKSNETYFNCEDDDICKQNIGYTKHNFERFIFISVSFLGVLCNFFLIIYNLVKKSKPKNRKASMRRIFLIFPLTDLLNSIYWLFSALRFNNNKKIQNEQKFCGILALFYIDVNTFQFILINFLLYHFRKINTNPIEGILKPNKKFVIGIITSFIFGALVSGLSEYFKIIGRSPLNTCFINTKYSDKYGYILLIPVLCIIIAIIQLIHDLFFVSMFNSDKGIRRIHRKNSLYVFIFCLLHIPLIICIFISLFKQENNFYNGIYEIPIIITTYLTCLIPLIMGIVRQIQGLARVECINECIRNKKKTKLLSTKTMNAIRNLTVTSKDDPSLSFDPFEWLERQVMEYFMRDILLGVSLCLKQSKKYDVYSNETINLNSQDFKDISKYEMNFENYNSYNLNDNSVFKTEYLNVKVIDYAPKCFSYLRHLEKIDIDEMIESFLPKNNSQGIKQSQGKSGSFFISTDDNKYMIKTLKPDELELIKHAFLEEYINYIKKNPTSLLCRLYGMYNIILGQGDEILIIVMRNVIGDFKENTIVKFDLKGSTYKRKANFDIDNNNNVMKDLDFNQFEKGIMLSLSSIKKLRDNTTKDSKFLRKLDLMDYSLFLVKLTLSKEEAEDTFGDNITEKQNKDFIQIISEKDINKYRKVKRKVTYRGEGNIHDVTHYRQYLFPSLNQGTAYIISIIDYFQIFNFFKYVESSIKTSFFQAKKKKIHSCVDPITYSNRFIKYINSLTDVKQFLSNEIQEAPKEEKNELHISDDDDDSDEETSIFKKHKKGLLSLENKHKKNELLLPIEVKPELSATYVEPNNNNMIDAE